MKPARIIMAGIVGGILVLAWSSVVHMATPIGEWGTSNLPSEETVLPAMRAGISEPGFYRFPGMNRAATQSQQDAWMEKYRTGPTGVVIYRPVGGEMSMGKLLGVEFGSDVLAALIAACIIAAVGGGVGRRIALGLGLALFAWLNLDVSYWNWDQFPGMLVLGSLIDQAGGWLLAAVAIGWIVGGEKAAAAP